MLKKLALGLVVVVSLYFQFLSVSHYNFAFTPDQAITMLSLRRLVVEHDLTLIGPETDFKGLYYGPFWYYFNIPAFLLGSGDPVFLVYLAIISLVLASVYFAKRVSLLSGIFFLISPHLLSTTRYSLNANFAPTLTIIYFALLWNNPSAIILGIITGLILQVEAALGIFFIPFTLIHNSNFKKIRFSVSYILGLFLTLIPQLLFEIKYGFSMTRAFLTNLSHPNPSDYLSLLQRTVSHFQSFSNLAKSLWPYSTHWLILVIFLFMCLVLLLNSKFKSIWLSSLFYIIFCFLGFSIYPKGLTHWYLYGLYPPILLIYLLPPISLLSLKSRLLKSLGAVFLIFVFVNFLSTGLTTVHDQLAQTSDDPSNLSNQLQTIDQAYSFAYGQPFTVYSFVPSIYDFQYHYLFWWYGQSKYGYRPSVMTYLPGVPEYIKNNQFYFKNPKPLTEDSPTIIIYDKTNPQAAINWLNYFPHLCINKSISLPWRTDIQLRYACK